MALRAHPVADSSPPTAAGRRQYTVFSLGDVMYAMEASDVKHVLPAQAAAAELVRLAGKPCPLLDLRTLFRLPAPAQPVPFILIVEREGRRAGILVDAIEPLTSLADAQIAPLPPVMMGRERAWFRGLARTPHGLLVLIDLGGLLRHSGALPARGASTVRLGLAC